MVVDTGATGNYIQYDKIHLLTNIVIDNTHNIKLPDGTTLYSSHRGEIKNINLPTEARTAYVFANLTVSLLSVGTLCCTGAKATFTRDNFTIINDGEVVLAGVAQGRLWFADVNPKTTAFDNVASLIYPVATDAQRMRFYQRVLCWPAKSTLLTALRDFNPFGTWPGLTSKLVHKHFQLTAETAVGRLDRTRRNYASTKPKVTYHGPDEPYGATTANTPTIFMKTFKVYTDISGQYKRKYYILILYFYDINYVMIEWLGESKTGTAYRAAYLKAMERYEATKGGANNVPKLEILDNAADRHTKELLRKRAVTFQLVAPNNHRRNAAEREMRTAQNQCICTFRAADDRYPENALFRLLPQAEKTLNLVRRSRINTDVAAWVELHGHAHDWNAHPMAPPGCPVLIYESPEQRVTMGDHGVPGFYINAADDHYRTYEVFVTATGHPRFSDTLAWLTYTHETTQDAIPGSFLPPPAYMHPDYQGPRARFDYDVAPLPVIPAPVAIAAPPVLQWEADPPQPDAVILPGPIAIAAPPVHPAMVPAVLGQPVQGGHPVPVPVPLPLQPAEPPAAPVQANATVPQPSPIAMPLATPVQANVPDPMPPRLAVPPASPVHTITARNQRDDHKPYLKSAIKRTMQEKGGGRKATAKRNVNWRQPVVNDNTTPTLSNTIEIVQKEGGGRSTIGRSSRNRNRYHEHDRHRTAHTRQTKRVYNVTTADNDPWFRSEEAIGGQNRPRQTHTISNENAAMLDRLAAIEASCMCALAHSYNVRNVNATATPPTVRDTPTAPPQLPPRASYKSLCRGPDREHWQAAFADEIRRLVYRAKVINWKRDQRIPKGRTASYANCVGYKKCINGVDSYRVRLAYGGDRSDYDGERTSTMTDITTVKCLLNAIVSDETLDYCTFDLTDMYLKSKLDRPEYMWMPITLLPQYLRDELGMGDLPEDTRILWEVTMALYGTPQAGMLAQRDVNRLLIAGGFYECPMTPCLYRHPTRNLRFVVWVDDFMVAYQKGHGDDVQYLLSVLKEQYDFKVDWTGHNYLGLTIDYDRQKRTITVSIPGYVKRMLAEFSVVIAARDPGSPIAYITPRYGNKGPQAAVEDDHSPPLDHDGIKFLQRVVGKTLYLARMVNPSIELAVNRIASDQAHGTTKTMRAAHRLLQYLAHHPEPAIVFKPSNMQLCIHADGSHLSEPKARSRAAAVLFLGDPLFAGPQDTDAIHTMQGPVATLCAKLPMVTQAAAETEYASSYMAAQLGEHVRRILIDLGYPQKPTDIVYDNTIAGKMANKTCKLRRSRAIDMRFHWLRDRVEQGHFRMVWRAGVENLADFLSKAHPVHHFKAMVPFFDAQWRPPEHLRTLTVFMAIGHGNGDATSGNNGRAPSTNAGQDDGLTDDQRNAAARRLTTPPANHRRNAAERAIAQVRQLEASTAAGTVTRTWPGPPIVPSWHETEALAAGLAARGAADVQRVLREVHDEQLFADTHPQQDNGLTPPNHRRMHISEGGNHTVFTRVNNIAECEAAAARSNVHAERLRATMAGYPGVGNHSNDTTTVTHIDSTRHLRNTDSTGFLLHPGIATDTIATAPVNDADGMPEINWDSDSSDQNSDIAPELLEANTPAPVDHEWNVVTSYHQILTSRRVATPQMVTELSRQLLGIFNRRTELRLAIGRLWYLERHPIAYMGNDDIREIESADDSSSDNNDDDRSLPDLVEVLEPSHPINHDVDVDWALSQEFIQNWAQSVINPSDATAAARSEDRHWQIAEIRPDLAHPINDMRRGILEALPEIRATQYGHQPHHLLHRDVYGGQVIDTGARQNMRPTANAYDIGRTIAFDVAFIRSTTIADTLTRPLSQAEFHELRHHHFTGDTTATQYGPPTVTATTNAVYLEREPARPDPVDDHRIRYFWFVRADAWGRIALYPPGHIHNTDPYEWTSIYPIPDDAVEGDLNGPWPVDNSIFSPQQ